MNDYYHRLGWFILTAGQTLTVASVLDHVTKLAGAIGAVAGATAGVYLAIYNYRRAVNEDRRGGGPSGEKE